MSRKVLVIGAGGVGQVAVHKFAMDNANFAEIVLASRRRESCEAVARDVEKQHGVRIKTDSVDAADTRSVIRLIKRHRPDIVVHLALPYQDLAIMEACLATKTDYLDTANYEPLDTAEFEYSWQWKYHEKFKEAGICAILGSGFDPGVTNVFTAYLAKHNFDSIDTLDIVDVNGGDHGQPFATNFNPEINIREVSADCKHWENGAFQRTAPLSVSTRFTCPGDVGTYNVYRMYHEELESIVKNFPSIKTARFWMSFSDNYLNHLQVLKNVGMTRIDAVDYQGRKIVPLQFLKAVLPEPSSLGPLTKGRTCIGVIAGGTKDGKRKSAYIYNICSHEDAYREVGSQAISYTTGVPAYVGTKLVVNGTWRRPGVWNLEQFDPDPFLAELGQRGLPWVVEDPMKTKWKIEG